jgi:TPR repeat protein
VAVQWFDKAAEQGHGDALRNLRQCRENGTPIPYNAMQGIIEECQRKADQGDAKYQFNLGMAYLKGMGVPEDPAEAVHWFRKAAEQGHSRAQTLLGYCYEKGAGVPRNEVKAVEWLRLAADQGAPDAGYALGIHYLYGRGVPQDETEGYALLALASANSAEARRLRARVEQHLAPEVIEAGKRRLAEMEKTRRVRVAD